MRPAHAGCSVLVAALLCGGGAAHRDGGHFRDKSSLPVAANTTAAGADFGDPKPFVHGDPHQMRRLAALVEVHSAENLTSEGVSDSELCRDLKEVTIGDHSVGSVLWMVCSLWPERFGRFPIASVADAQSLADKLFIAGGLWDTVRSMADRRKKSEKFCWRRQYMREPLQPADYLCPSNISHSEAVEALEEDDSTQMEEGQWSCKNSQENPGRICSCGRSDLPNFRLDDIESLPDKARARIYSVPGGCDMVSLGTCYGECPYGFQKALITGTFRPVCSTMCTESTHPVPCGFGCSNTKMNCAKVTVKQVSQVVKVASQVVSLVTGHPHLHTLVDALINLVEFVVTALAKMINFVVKLWKGFTSGQKKIGLVFTIMQFAAEMGGSIMGDMMQMKKTFKDIMSLFGDLINAEWKFGLNIGIISNVVKKFSAQSIFMAYQVADAFVWPKCKVADRTTIFTIEKVGDPRLLGHWMKQGSHSGRPRYTKVDDPNTRIEWSDSRKSWRAFYDDTWWGVKRETLYNNKQNVPDVPVSGWEVFKGKAPAPFLNMVVHHDH